MSSDVLQMCRTNAVSDLREFVFANERHPESGRAVPRPGTGTNVCNSGDKMIVKMIVAHKHQAVWHVSLRLDTSPVRCRISVWRQAEPWIAVQCT